jgi:hypothetical protein
LILWKQSTSGYHGRDGNNRLEKGRDKVDRRRKFIHCR